VGDLLSQSEALALEPDAITLDPYGSESDFKAAFSLLQEGLQQLGQRTTQGLRQWLLQSQLFIPHRDGVKDLRPALTQAHPNQAHPGDLKLALVWSAVGLLLMVQTDWLLGQFLNATPAPGAVPGSGVPLATSSPASSLTATSINPAQDQDQDKDSLQDRDGTQDENGASGRDDALVEPDDSWNLPELSLQKTTEPNPGIFEGEDFTQAGSGLPDRASGSSGPFQTESTLETPQPAISEIEPAVAAIENQVPIVDPNTLQSPYATFTSKQLNQKLALYYQRLEESGPPDVLIFGSSRALRGINPAALNQSLASLGYNDVDIFNFGINGSTAQIVELTLRRILTPDQLPKLVIWADGARAFNSGRVDITYNAVAVSPGYQQLAQQNASIPAPPNQPDDSTETDLGQPLAAGDNSRAGGAYTSLRDSYTEVDHWLSETLAHFSNIYPNRDRLQSQIQGQVASLLPGQVSGVNPLGKKEDGNITVDFLTTNQETLDIYGFLPLDIQFNPATYYQKYARVSGDYDGDYEAFQLEGRQDIALKVLLEFTESQDIPLVFVNMPLTDEYLDAARFRYERQFRQYMYSLATDKPHFIFRDLGELWTQQFNYFSDPSHLNRYGAYQVSSRLAQDPLIPWPAPENQ